MRRISRVIFGLQLVTFITSWLEDAKSDNKIDGEEVGDLMTGIAQMIGPMFGYSIEVRVNKIDR